MTDALTPADPKDWKRVGSILGNDKITDIHIANLLLAEGILATTEGSRTYEIKVPSAKVETAIKLLRSDARKLRYHIWFDTDDVVEPPEPEEIIRRIPVSSVLQMPNYASQTALGRFLRSKDISQLTAKYPYLFSLAVRKRPYLATPKTYSIGYDVTLELHKSDRKRADGYRGWCQIWNDGREINIYGSNAWQLDKS